MLITIQSKHSPVHLVHLIYELLFSRLGYIYSFMFHVFSQELSYFSCRTYPKSSLSCCWEVAFDMLGSGKF